MPMGNEQLTKKEKRDLKRKEKQLKKETLEKSAVTKKLVNYAIFAILLLEVSHSIAYNFCSFFEI